MTALNFEQHLADVMKWHFSPNTGSAFWLERQRRLEFDPLRDVRSFADLALFPDVSSELRDVPIEDLHPRGLKRADIAGVFESGGTTGTPKRVVAYGAWFELLIDWRLEGVERSSDGAPKNTLAIVPGGPHIVGAVNLRRARALGGQCFTVDLDPRWVKKLIARRDFAGVKAYAEHLVDQAEAIIASQHIAYLVTTPPLLEAIARRRPLVEHLNRTLETINWGGTQMDVDTLDHLKSSVFPDVAFTASYGSTMILGDTKSRHGQDHAGAPIFDSFAPYVVLEVVDAETRRPVAFNERGRVVMNHLSRFALIPNVLERDTAVRLPPLPDRPGAAVADVRPVPEVDGQAVIEGVY